MDYEEIFVAAPDADAGWPVLANHIARMLVSGVAAGEVGDVVAGSDVGFNGHGGPPDGYGARQGGHGHRVMHRYRRFGLRTRTHGCRYGRTLL